MDTVGEDLDWCQRFLRDTGVLWPRAELLTAYRRGLRDLLARSQGVRRFVVLELPPQVPQATSRPRLHPTERAGGPWRQYTLSGVTGAGVVTSRWQVEQAEGLTPHPGGPGVTQLHYLVAEMETHYLIALPHAHERICGIWYDHQPLEALTVRELDGLETDWWNEAGAPVVWTPGLGETRAAEVYPLPKHLAPAYQLTGGAYPFGIARTLQGTRETTWQTTQADWDPEAPPLGLIRRLSSPERQYAHRDWWEVPLGRQCHWASSAGTLLIWEAIVPDVPALEETSRPTMIPAPLTKYLRYYVLAQAFNRLGEGSQGTLAQHWEQRWLRGVRLLQRLTDLTWADVHYQRLPSQTHRRDLPLGRLPSPYPRLRH